MATRIAYVVTGKWPLHQLSKTGAWTDCFVGGGPGHIGIFFPCCNNAEIAAHSVTDVSEPNARGCEHVCFDYMLDKHPRFQKAGNTDYWTDTALVYTFPILNVDFTALHTACVNMARYRPYNSTCFRINPLLGGCLPCTFAGSGTPKVGPSTCVAITMRLIAQARTGDAVMLTEDDEVIAELGLPTGGCSPTRLVGYTPGGAVRVLSDAGVIGDRLRGFGPAKELCLGGPKGVGTWIPPLQLLIRR
tara:strand:+ start:2177 stop:2914 length:738 start_codon:yes stop_codon:yes gene_type:complete